MIYCFDMRFAFRLSHDSNAFAVLECYAGQIVNWLPSFRASQSPQGCAKTSLSSHKCKSLNCTVAGTLKIPKHEIGPTKTTQRLAQWSCGQKYTDTGH